jgi:hypothetical protein
MLYMNFVITRFESVITKMKISAGLIVFKKNMLPRAVFNVPIT